MVCALVCLCGCVFVHDRVCLFVSFFVWLFVCLFVFVIVRLFVCLYVCLFVCLRVCLCVYMCRIATLRLTSLCVIPTVTFWCLGHQMAPLMLHVDMNLNTVGGVSH